MRWVVLVLLVALLGVGLVAYGLGIFPPRRPAFEMANVSPAAAAVAEMKLARLQSHGEEARLTGVELTSLFRYRPEVWSLGAVRSPLLRLSGDTLWISGSIPTDQLPSQPEIDAIRFFLPDTARVDLGGTVRGMGRGTAVLEITSVEVAGMPIPPRYFPLIIDRLGGEGEAGLPRSAFVLPLPPGIGSARVAGDELILTP
jgi:hypothetical protein